MVVLYGPEFYGPVDTWFCVSIAIAYFTYMVMDNCDGKQARRTGTSSPLGMLLDHGMDSVTAVINNFLLQRVMQIGNNYFCLIGLLVSTMPFYFAMLEQYYTGELILQVVNGVDDGSLGYIAFCLLTATYGISYWTQEFSIFGLPPVQLSHLVIYVLFAALAVCTAEK